MEGRIYIAGAFRNLNFSTCSAGEGKIDNDPHFYIMPPTWGICRTDLRRVCSEGDYIFYVLPKINTVGVQSIFAYLKVTEKMNHVDAFTRFPQKRMANKKINGNIIVNEDGSYNRFDANQDHRRRFESIKQHYIVGDETASQFLKKEKIMKLGKEFPEYLNNLFDGDSKTIFQIITRGGRILSESQVKKLLQWLKG